MILLFLLMTVTSEAPSTASDRDAVRAVVKRFESAWNQGDVDALIGTYTDPHVDVNDRGQSLTRAATRARLEALRPGAESRLRITSTEVVIEGDLAFQRGEIVLTPVAAGAADGATTKRYLEILRRGEDGEWRVWWSMDGPIASEAGE
jgi:uncharacterized protein (TIGR02246 family)